MAKATLKTVERKTTVSRNAISEAIAIVMGYSKPSTKTSRETENKSSHRKKKLK